MLFENLIIMAVYVIYKNSNNNNKSEKIKNKKELTPA